ncbi:MAG: nucleoside hydrolase [Acidobacteria bacterium]|nr:nucleoside hydrolase [Acidobacteriota bacterium]
MKESGRARLGRWRRQAPTDVHRIIFDTDSAVFNDDAAALAMLLGRPDRVAIEGITVVAGNHTVPQGAEHMLHLLELTGSSHVPLYLGAPAPLVNTPERAARQEARWGPISFKGAFDAGPAVEPPHGGRFATVRPRPTDAVSYIVETAARHPGEITLVAVGPLTNVALALRREPGLAGRLRSLVFMGGNARVPGNVNPAAEFNFWFDPEAAAEVLGAAFPRVVMFGLDITNHAPLHRPLFERMVAADTPLTRLMRHDMGPAFAGGPGATQYVWDCITAAWLIDPSVVTRSERLPIRVETTFGPSYGGSSVEPGGSVVEAMLDLDLERFYAMYADLITRPLGPER